MKLTSDDVILSVIKSLALNFEIKLLIRSGFCRNQFMAVNGNRLGKTRHRWKHDSGGDVVAKCRRRKCEGHHEDHERSAVEQLPPFVYQHLQTILLINVAEAYSGRPRSRISD